jgi:hypothetical protein
MLGYGVNYVQGWFVTTSLQLNQDKLPKPHKTRITYKIIQCYKVT